MSSKSHNHLVEDAPVGLFDIYDSHRTNYEEAIRRIKEEGQVVRDMRGAVVAHPSLQIQQTSADAMVQILAKYGKKVDGLLDGFI
jgi:phage terminase small subunit